MKVYVVLHGECNEGGGVVSVHKTEKSAIKAALAVPCVFEGGWRPDPDGSKNFWLNGCDYVTVQSYEVK